MEEAVQVDIGTARPSTEVVSMLRSLRESIGAPLTAALTGAGSPMVVKAWIAGRAPMDSCAEQRLRDAYDVTKTLLAVDSPEIVRAWLLGMNPALDDRAPAVVIADDPAAVMRAARYYVANG
ncbi:MAG: XRE family transcriptional regulator [Chloroflexota bacterium]